MILSQYAELIKGGDDFYYLFSCMSKKWFKLDPALADIFKGNQKDLAKLQDIHPEFFDALLSEGFLAESSDEDIEKGINKVKEIYNSSESLSITINPTLDCNLRCWYCYENRKAGSKMSEETIAHAIRFISSQIESGKVKNLKLSFFGGEPLLYFKQVVSPIIKQISEKCKYYGINLSIHFTTNGVLISDAILSELKALSKHITFQIAFDGNREYHNKVKFFGNGKGCYDRTIIKAKKALDAGFFLTVRCNYNKTTLPSFINVVKDFKDYHNYNNLRFLFQRIWQEKNDYELKELKKEIFNKIKNDYKVNSNINDLNNHSLSRCYADYKHNIVINYDGLIFRCTARDFKKENAIGLLTDKGLEIAEVPETVNKIEDIPYGSECRKCRILPICPNCIQNRKERNYSNCPILKNNEESDNLRRVFEILSGVNIK